jgi:mono/diheme cytochrome c family protein
MIYVALVAGLQQCIQRNSKQQQYYVQGEQLYLKHCSNCHQKDGTGLGLLYPPVDRSDYVDSRFEEVICLMKYGKSGEIVVNGKVYNQPMPGVTSLTNLELAEIATYLYNSWSRKQGLIDVNQVAEVITQCKQVE